MKKAFQSSYVFVFVLLMLLSCGKSLPTLQNIDITTWVQDKNACNGQRTKMLIEFQNQKDKLLGLSEAQIIELLGRPDHNELYKRNQKFYYYFLQPALHCKSGGSNEAMRLVVRFSAMGIAKEVSVEF